MVVSEAAQFKADQQDRLVGARTMQVSRNAKANDPASTTITK
jgi:hypothetical protein